MPSETPPPATVVVRQDTETALTTLQVPFGMVLYLYARSNDSVDAQTIGQDYLSFRYSQHDLAFVVCDGVGQSFIGDLAARLLGIGLLDVLWELARPGDEAAFARELTDALNRLTETSKVEVAGFELPVSLPPIVKQALNLQRDYGSESMFVAGRLALTADDPWVGLCWLGDSPVAAVDVDGKLVDLGPRGHTSERWNATTGLKGNIHTWLGDARHVARVAGYTDGLSTGRVPTDADLATMIEGWKTVPPADDASLFDVRLAPSPATTGQPAPQSTHPSSLHDTRPIPRQKETTTPVAGHKPIEREEETRLVTGWEPLPGKEAAPSDRLPAPDQIGDLRDLSHQQQMQLWQQAAILGLTSAALAMLMVEKLAAEQNKGNKT